MALYTTTSFPLTSLVEDIAQGKIGLPDIQRPFVWPNVNVRNLFDSLYKGYPAGYLLFWETGTEASTRSVSGQERQKAPSMVIVDGQQRLTSLFAVIKGREVVKSDFARERIRIAFNPLQCRFDVTDASVVKDKAYIPDISELWKPETSLFEFAGRFIEELKQVRQLTPEEINSAQNAIGKLHNLLSYSFTALTLSASVDAETVAEVFVRINGEGKKLNQSDFIMTLMSVFWDEGRSELEGFARAAAKPPGDGQASPYNPYLRPSPDQMLRVDVGLGLKRARLENVYSALRGRDAVTGQVDVAKRDAQFNLLKVAQSRALNLADWHQFLSALSLAGYRNEAMITSQNAIVYSYVLYLIGVYDHLVERSEMRQVIAEFFFMASLTQRYTNSPETAFEFDLAQLRDVSSRLEFIGKLRQICTTTLTTDFWEITLPNNLATSAPVSPSRSAYLAAQIVLGAKALYGRSSVADAVDAKHRGLPAQAEQQPLFAKTYLKTIGVTETRRINQIANFAYVGWSKDVTPGNRAPRDYIPALDAALTGPEREEMLKWHALPFIWWELPYEEILQERRGRMAQVIRAGYQKLCGAVGPIHVAPMSVADLLRSGESDSVEFKSSLRINLNTHQQDPRIELSALKTIAGFLNAQGGTLVVGVADDGRVLGIGADAFDSDDRMSLHLVNLVRDRIGPVFLPYVHPHFEDSDGGRVLVIRCEKGAKACFRQRRADRALLCAWRERYGGTVRKFGHGLRQGAVSLRSVPLASVKTSPPEAAGRRRSVRELIQFASAKSRFMNIGLRERCRIAAGRRRP